MGFNFFFFYQQVLEHFHKKKKTTNNSTNSALLWSTSEVGLMYFGFNVFGFPKPIKL